MDKHSFPNGKRLVRDTLKPDDNLHYEKFSDGTVKCIEDEIPFDVPEGWTWARLNDLALYKKGPFGSSITKAMFVPESDNAIKVYEQKNAINKNAHLGHYFISQEKYQELKGFEIFPGDIIVSCAGTIGETFVMPSDMRKGIINQALMKIHLYDNSIKDFYLMYFDNKLKSLANEQGYGMALKNIPPFSVLKQYLIPIPPMAEQEKILKRIKIILSNINDIDLLKGKLQSNIANAKSKILDLAIRGKLVPQDPNDEPASVLLERIRVEKEEQIKQGKIKRNKKESVIFKGSDNSYYEKIGDDIICIDDEIPFETPINWQWVRLGSTVGIERGGSPRPIKSYITTDSNGINWIKIGDVDKDGKYITNTKEKIKPTGIKKSREVYPGDFLLTNSMSFGRPYISKIYGCIHDGWLVLRNPDVVFDINFLYYLLSSNYLYNQFVIKASGSTVDNLNIDKVSSALICLPPLKEQTMIVNQIEKIIRLIQPFEELL